MDSTSFAVRRSRTGKQAEDLVVGVDEAKTALGVQSTDLASAADARIAASANAATIGSQADSGRATATSTQLGDKAAAINTTGKFKGKTVYDTTSDLIYFALGATDTSKWRLTGSTDGTGDITPA